jgi:uncharacterized membrane protein YdfJ with MMPL/SSD domain
LLSVPYWAQSNPHDSGRGIRTGFSGISTIPDDIQTKQAFDVLITKFPTTGQQSTADVVIPGASSDPTVEQGIQDLETAAANNPSFGEPQPAQTSADGTVTLVRFPFAGEATDESSEAAVDAVTALRDDYVPQAFGADSGVLVGGDTALTKDFFDISNFYTPIIIALVLGLSFILLTVVFRSIVVPAKAIVMNLLSVGAAYGLLTLVFQDGHGEGILGFESNGGITSWLPLFLFVILFGLSMDYHVFILSRVREAWKHGMSSEEAVAHGIKSTAGTVTSAAVVMVAVFAIFATLSTVDMKQLGVGLAFAILIDATIIRGVLLPATMKLLGDRNWYLPRWLQWLPELDHEGGSDSDADTGTPRSRRGGAGGALPEPTAA